MEREYVDYEKISATIGHFGNFILKHEIKLARANKVKKRELLHREYRYKVKSYSDKTEVSKIDIGIKSYLLLYLQNNEMEWFERNQLYITTSNVYTLIYQFKRIRKLFYEHKDMYMYDHQNKLILGSEFKSKAITFKFNNNVIKLEPTVIVDKDSDSEFEGINLYINDTINLGQVTINQLNNLIHTLDGINIYSAGIQLLNYLGRPTLGTNEIDMVSRKSEKINYLKENMKSDIKSNISGYNNSNELKL